MYFPDLVKCLFFCQNTGFEGYSIMWMKTFFKNDTINDIAFLVCIFVQIKRGVHQILNINMMYNRLHCTILLITKIKK